LRRYMVTSLASLPASMESANMRSLHMPRVKSNGRRRTRRRGRRPKRRSTRSTRVERGAADDETT
jgi:hypothetical protein